MNNYDDLISLIVPIYNVEKYLDKCLTSIINQTYQNLEIILIDDGSSDNCPQICDNWAQKDNRIKVIHKKNGGVSEARNTGLDNATGNYIGFVDSDDYLHKDMYLLLLKALKESNSHLAICNYFIVENDKPNQIGISKPPTDILAKELLSDHGIKGFNWNKLYSTELLKNIRFDSNIKIWEDLLFNYQLISNHQIGYAYVSQPLYYYVQRSSSALHDHYSLDLTRLNVLEFIIEKLTKIDRNMCIEKKVGYILMFENSKFMRQNQNPNYNYPDFKHYEEQVRIYLQEGLLTEKINLIDKLKIILAVYFPSGYKLLKKISK